MSHLKFISEHLAVTLDPSWIHLGDTLDNAAYIGPDQVRLTRR